MIRNTYVPAYDGWNLSTPSPLAIPAAIEVSDATLVSPETETAPFEFTLLFHASQIGKVGFNAPATGDNYGWFNEVCIVSGVESVDIPVYVEELITEDENGIGWQITIPHRKQIKRKNK